MIESSQLYADKKAIVGIPFKVQSCSLSTTYSLKKKRPA